MKWGVCVAVVAACGFAVVASCVGDSSTTNDAGSDATTDQFVAPDTSANDGGDAAAPSCDLSKPFGTPVAGAPPINSTANDTSIWFLPDLLTVFVTSSRAGGGVYDIYSGTRMSIDAGFAALAGATNLNAVGTGAGCQGSTLTDDGLTIYFSNGSSGAYTAWTSARGVTTVDFPAPSQLAAPINGSGTENGPAWITPDGGTLYFMSNRAGTRDIYTATRGTGGFNAPVALASVNSPAQEDNIVLTPDELQAFLTRGAQLFYASRTTSTNGFSVPAPIAEINAFSSPVSVSFVSADGCTLYFDAPTADGGANPYDLYMATRGQ